VLIWLLVWFAFLPCVTASQATTPFPEIKFSIFSNFISSTFNPNISLATVLVVFFSLIENPELLNLHARQKNPQLSSENSIISSAWMHALCRQLKDHLPNDGFVRLFKKNEFTPVTWEDDLARKLDGFAECLGLTPYQNGSFHKKLLPVSQKSIQPEYVICPLDMECTKSSCGGRHLTMSIKKRDIPTVTLIKGTSIFKDVSVLTGQCKNCHTLYSAHLQSYKNDPQDKINHDRTEIISNSARYLQIGRNMWADRSFSNAVVKSMYSFHASANTYCDYWNSTFGFSNSANRLKLGRKQVWQAFVQESIRTVASSDDVDFETPANLSIDDLTKKAFYELGNGGRISIANDHSCSECTKPFKESVTDTTIHPDAAPVKMVVLDGIVMGPTVSCCLQSNYYLMIYIYIN
jgi:CxC5 like cysteine cluster associated with KDZ transposases